MKSQITRRILLFIKNNSVYFASDIDNFKKIIETLGQIAPFEVEIIDVREKPELAEEYRVDALPTLIVGDIRYVGKPSPEKAMEIFKKA